MAFKFNRSSKEPISEINVTPFVDVMLVLLIIFMITTPLLEQTVALNLPVEAAKTQAEDREDFQSISIDRAGAYYWGEGQVSEQQLADLLDTMAMELDPPVLSIRADAQLDYQNVITVVDMIKQRKLSKISLDTKVE